MIACLHCGESHDGWCPEQAAAELLSRGLPAAKPGRYAVIPTRNRPDDLARCVEAIAPQVDLVIVIDNGSDPPAAPPIIDGKPHLVIYDPEQPPNLSRMWNIGLDAAALDAMQEQHQQWDVAVLNDDATVPPGWFDACTAAMRTAGAAAGCTVAAAMLLQQRVYREPGPVELWARLTGWAFILRGEYGLRADEDLRWWYGDDDLDWQARQSGGTVILPGYPVPNLHADTTTVGELAEQAGRDRATFEAKWGRAPW